MVSNGRYHLLILSDIFRPREVAENTIKMRPKEEICLDGKEVFINGMEHGVGGNVVRMNYTILRRPSEPMSKTAASNAFEGDFQFMSVMARLQTFMIVLWRTFHSRIPNPISRHFIGYWMEPIGKGHL